VSEVLDPPEGGCRHSLHINHVHWEAIEDQTRQLDGWRACCVEFLDDIYCLGRVLVENFTSMTLVSHFISLQL